MRLVKYEDSIGYIYYVDADAHNGLIPEEMTTTLKFSDNQEIRSDLATPDTVVTPEQASKALKAYNYLWHEIGCMGDLEFSSEFDWEEISDTIVKLLNNAAMERE